MAERSKRHWRIGAAGFLGLVLVASSACAPSLDESMAQIRAFHAEGRFEETLAPLQSLLDDHPESIELNRMLGVALAASDSPSTAVWVLRRVTELPEHSVEDVFLLAQAYGRGGDHDRGLETATRVLEIDPGHMGGLVMSMTLAGRLSRWEEVVESADRILAAEPGRRHVYQSKAEALIALDRVDEAETALVTGRAQTMNRPFDSSVEASYCELEIEVAEKLEQHDEVDSHLNACLARTRGGIEFVDYAVALYDEREDGERATALLARLLKAAPLRFDLRKRLADRLDEDGQSDAALQMMHQATEFEGAELQAWLVIAEFHRERDDYAAAARAIERVLVARETVPALMMAEYGDDLLQAGELDKAEEVIGKIERPEWAALMRGRLFLERGDPVAAMEELQAGIRLWPGNGTARLLAARAAEKLGEFDQAILEYRNAVRSDVESTSAVYELATLYEAEGRYPAAFFPLNVLLQRKSDDARAGLDLVRIALLAEHAPLAIDAVKSLKSNDQPLAALLGESMIARAGDGPAAASDLLSAADLDLTRTQNVQILEALVGHLIDAGRKSEALERARAAAAANPEEPEYHRLLGRALRAVDRGSDAMKAYEQAVALDPENAGALSGLAALSEEDGRPVEAMELYDRAALADVEDAQPAWAAVLLALDVEPDAAVDQRLDALLYAHPRHAQAANFVARRLLDRGSDLTRADQLARRAIRFQGGADAFETLGLIALEQGENRRAVQSFLRSLELRPKSPDTRYYLAQALIRVDKLEAARRALVAALASGELSNAPAARADLARLEGKRELPDE